MASSISYNVIFFCIFGVNQKLSGHELKMKINYRTKTDEACQNDVNLGQLTKLVIDARRFLKSTEMKTTKVIHNNTTNLIVWSQELAVFSYSLSHMYSLFYRIGQLTYMVILYSAKCIEK